MKTDDQIDIEEAIAVAKERDVALGWVAPESWSARCFDPLTGETVVVEVGPAQELVRHVLDEDHSRGCEGRCYTCSCGYDARTIELAEQVSTPDCGASRAGEAELQDARLADAPQGGEGSDVR
jgi:hypothetical protein